MFIARLTRLVYARKEVVKFIVTGVTAVIVDLTVYSIGLASIVPFVTDLHIPLLGHIFNEAIVLKLTHIEISKMCGYIFGTMTAYLLNKYWTFGVKEKSIREFAKFLIIYGTSFLINVSVNSLAFGFFSNHIHWFNLILSVDFIRHLDIIPVLPAFVVATATSTIINFAGLKLWVFKPKTASVLR